MKVVVVGGTGVLGRRTVPLIEEQGHQVTALVRSPGSGARLPGTPVVVGDVWDRAFLRTNLAGADAVMMLATAVPSAAQAGKAKAWRQNDRIRSILAPQVAQVATECGVARFVQESVMYVYADAGDSAITEESLVEPSPQAVACLTAEHAARRFRQDRDIIANSVVLRFAGFVAPESDQIQMTLDWAKRGRALVFGDLKGYLTFVHADDAARAAAAALSLPSGIYNVGADPVRKDQHLAELATVVGRKSVRRLPKPARVALSATMPITRPLARSLRIDSTKIRANGWSPRFQSSQHVWMRVSGEVSGHG